MPDNERASLATLQKSSVASLIRQYLSAFVPGYAVFAELLSSRLGIDSDKVLAVLGFFVAGWASMSYLKNTVIPNIAASFTSTLTVKTIDYGHASLQEWLHSHGALSRSRLVWSSGWAPLTDSQVRNAAAPQPVETAAPGKFDPGTGELFNYSRSRASKPIEYAPESGLYLFIHRWRPFLVLSSKFDNPDDVDRGLSFFRLYTLGNSTKPLEDIVQEAVGEKLASRLSETTVWRASGSQWSNSSQRPARPMNTISLETSLKSELVIDLNTYLQPGRADWYAARGVPYRRGLLFYGPPGCGKTSMAFSLAGTFGLDVYIANLTSGYGINEDDLQYLMNELPERCVLVIEDIDAIAVDREKAKKDPAFRSKTKNEKEAYISLSGLLNALDGMFAKEGRLLVMTSNFREYLDAAILRPGRVDKQVKFDLMTRSQIADIFVRMFGSTKTDRKPPLTVSDAINDFQPDVSYAGCPYETADDLRAAAKEFAEKFPERKFSPAALQEYLIEVFEDPEHAISGADAWIERELTRLKEKEERQLREMKEMEEESKRWPEMGPKILPSQQSVAVAETDAEESAQGAVKEGTKEARNGASTTLAASVAQYLTDDKKTQTQEPNEQVVT